MLLDLGDVHGALTLARRARRHIDDALDEETAKRAFWSAFRRLGDWYADFPPY